MRPLTEARPKAMLPVAGKPFAHHQLSWLAASGVTRVLYSIGHLGQQLRDFVGDGRAWGLRVEYVDDGPTLRGTGGALRLALDAGLLDEAFFVLYGDSYLPIEVAPVEAAFRASGRPALMTVFRNRDRWGQSNAIVEGTRVARYDKVHRDAAMEHLDYGLSVLTREVVRARLPPGAVAELATTLHALSVEGQLAAYEVTARFYEIGSAAGLADLEGYLGASR
jgi:NDP-sugar pyrophosphorylase family protein